MTEEKPELFGTVEHARKIFLDGIFKKIMDLDPVSINVHREIIKNNSFSDYTWIDFNLIITEDCFSNEKLTKILNYSFKYNFSVMFSIDEGIIIRKRYYLEPKEVE